MLRIFITEVQAGTKGSSAVAVKDLETVSGQSCILISVFGLISEGEI